MNHIQPSSSAEVSNQYQSITNELTSLFTGENRFFPNTANFVAHLYHRLETVNWVGFYFLQDQELVLGPFQGKIACTTIPLGKGVCGTSAMNRKTLIVPDVHKFEGHIACDVASQSEIVIPIIDQDQNLYGVLDLDSPIKDRFNTTDQAGLESLVSILLDKTDFDLIKDWGT